MDGNTEALTGDGWKRHYELKAGDRILVICPDSKDITWQSVRKVYRDQGVTEVVHWKNSHGFNVVSSPRQQWLAAHRDRNGYTHFEAAARLRTTADLSSSNRQLITGGGFSQAFAMKPSHEDPLVELVGWVITEGHYQKQRAQTGVLVAQSPKANPEKTKQIRKIKIHFARQGATATENPNSANGMINFYFGAGIGNVIREVAPDKQITPAFLRALTLQQAERLYQTILDGDGHRTKLRSHDGYNRTVSTENFIQKDPGRIDSYQMLAAMLGKRTCAKPHKAKQGIFNTVTYHRPLTTARHLKDDRISHSGVLWSPHTEMGTWLARREGGTFWIGELGTSRETEGHPAASFPEQTSRTP
ncbi:hypothetical protein [Streptomyces celluloflavus]|uniref:hypothetical protein n=1 Tax=Streptomyces celluloflavus TaxID=58344 RepID=UPI00345FD144|nr:hypothetical protein OG717_02150 [Streptomyces celluloflavus]